MLLTPDFGLNTNNPNPSSITDAVWWMWERCLELEPSVSELGGILAWKSGFHSTGEYNVNNYPDNYSIRDEPNKTGPWWFKFASALDWTFRNAQSGDYSTISRYTSRLISSGKDSNDPRLDMVLYELFGQADWDSGVEGWNEYRDESASSDSSHLWHIHFSFLRSKCGDMWSMWALYTVLLGWSVAQWQASLTGVDAMFCKYNDEGENVVALQEQLLLLDPGCLPQFGPDGGYGNETSAAVSRLVTGGDGHTYQGKAWAKMQRLCASKSGGGTPGPKGDKGDPGAPGKTPTQVTFGPVNATVTAVS